MWHSHCWVRAHSKQLPALSLMYLITCVYGQMMILVYSASVLTWKNSIYSKGFSLDL